MVTSEQGDLLSACPPPPNPDLHPHQICWYTTATNLGSDHLLIIGNIARWRRCGFEKHSPFSLWCEFKKVVVLNFSSSSCLIWVLSNWFPNQMHSHSGCTCEYSLIIFKMIESRWGGVPREDPLGQCHLPQRSRPSLTACKPSDGYPPGPIIPSKWSSLPILEHKAGFRSFLVYIGDLPGAACCFITRASTAPSFFYMSIRRWSFEKWKTFLSDPGPIMSVTD